MTFDKDPEEHHPSQRPSGEDNETNVGIITPRRLNALVCQVGDHFLIVGVSYKLIEADSSCNDP